MSSVVAPDDYTGPSVFDVYFGAAAGEGRDARSLTRDTAVGRMYFPAWSFEDFDANPRWYGPPWSGNNGEQIEAPPSMWNRLFIPAETTTALMDGFELACEAVSVGGARHTCGEVLPADANNFEALEAAQAQLECTAQYIEHRAALSVFANMPSSALDALRESSPVGGVPALGGDYAVNVTRLRTALVAIATTPGLMGAELRAVASDLEQVRIELQRSAHRDRLATLSYESTQWNQVTACATAVATISGIDPAGAAGRATAAGFSCINAAIQGSLARMMRDVSNEDEELARSATLLAAMDRLQQHLSALYTLNSNFLTQQENADAALASLESIRAAAAHALATMLSLDADTMGRTWEVNTVMRRRYNTRRVRYIAAQRDAVELAYLARIAIEQRFGVHLDEMTEEMSLVAAPATWVGDVCVAEGVDYRRISRASPTGDADDEADYAESYVGDYVTKLEQFVESYRIDHPFLSGADTAVVSLRDDIHGVRATCDTPVNNLLRFTENLTGSAKVDGRDVGWSAVGCRVSEIDGTPLPNCVSVSLSPDDVVPPPTASPTMGRLVPHRIALGGWAQYGSCSPCNSGDTCIEGHCVSTPICGSSCGVDSDAPTAWSQTVPLSPGVFRVSYYWRKAVESAPPVFGALVRSTTPDAVANIDWRSVELADDWRRDWTLIRVDRAADVEILLTVIGDLSPITIEGAADFAGVMLERLDVPSDDIPSSVIDQEPGTFLGTERTSTRPMMTCEDTTGMEFQRSRWTRACLPICERGIGLSCGPDSTSEKCYWQTEFTIAQNDTERGLAFGNAGFALGNFNYRTDGIALNVVGTGVRDCRTAEAPSGCYGSGFVQYSLTHIGPYNVRSWSGDTYDAPLFTATIEHARALAAEEYVTNPRGVDSLAEYVRREFRGRPVDGTYRLQIWDEPGVAFKNVEDVQIVLDYTYWSRAR